MEGIGMDFSTVCNEDTVFSISSSKLAAKYFASIPVNKEPTEFESMLIIEKTKRISGYKPQQSWRNYVK